MQTAREALGTPPPGDPGPQAKTLALRSFLLAFGKENKTCGRAGFSAENPPRRAGAKRQAPKGSAGPACAARLRLASGAPHFIRRAFGTTLLRRIKPLSI